MLVSIVAAPAERSGEGGSGSWLVLPSGPPDRLWDTVRSFGTVASVPDEDTVAGRGVDAARLMDGRRDGASYLLFAKGVHFSSS